MRSKLYIFLVLLVIGCTNSENSRIDLERLKVVEELLTDDINNNKIPGAVVLVGNEKEIVYQKAFGVKNPLTNEKYATDDIFRIASMTKAITSVAVLKLWEDGRINLDDPIEKYIPEFKDTEILETFNEKDSSYTSKPSTKKITIRQLLTHTSGIGYDFIDGNPSIKAIFHKKKQSFMKNGVMCFCDEDVTIGEAIRNLAEVPLHHEPGEKFTYSMGLDVLGYMIEIVSGKKLDVFYREEIFDPLDMNDTYFYLPDSKKERLVPVQTKKDENWVIFEDDRFNENYPIEGKRKFFAGGCGLSSTVEDYYKFLSVFLNNGKYGLKQIISPSTNNLIQKDQLIKITNSPEQELGHGLISGIVREKDFLTGASGGKGTIVWGGYFNTAYFADPTENIIGIIYKQTQLIDESASGRFNQIIYGALID